MSFSFVKNHATNQTPEVTLLIMGYELGLIQDSLEADSIEHARTESSDFLTMTRMYNEQAGWEEKELEEILFMPPGHCGLYGSYDILIKSIFKNLAHLYRSHLYTKVFISPLFNNQKKDIEEILKYYRALNDNLLFNTLELWDMGQKRFINRMRDIAKTGKTEELREYLRKLR